MEHPFRKLDVELVSQQAEKGVLDFQDYATYVINVMAQLCAPVRDEEIAALRAMSSDVVPLFQVRSCQKLVN